MKELNSNWFTEGWVDFELKKYTLLAYLKEVRTQFDQTLLYPAFSDLIFHYRNLVSYQDEQQKIREKFPKELRKIDLENIKLEYVPTVKDENEILEVGNIVNYSIPLLKGAVEDGREIFEFIDEKLEIGPVGVIPLMKEEGYLFFRGGRDKQVNAYEYKITLFESAEEKFRAIRTQFIETFYWSISNTFESMKMQLIRNHKKLPNPATFAIVSEIRFPIEESLLPVAKRKFMRFLAGF